MAHQHQVVDGDIRFTINPITRAITRADAKKSSLVVGDHNSERFTFSIPKTVEGHDMSLCNVIRVHYLNTSSDNKTVQSLGVYEVDDFAPDPEDETVMKFSWVISKKATKHVGPLAFTIQFACMTGFKVDYSWQSGVFSGITVTNAVNGAEVVIEEYADILQQWWEQLYASSELPIMVMPLEDFEALEGDTENGVLYVISDDPAVEDLEKIPGIEQDITKLNGDVQTNKQSITSLNLEVQTNKQNITKLNGDVQTNKQDITTLNSKFDELEQKAYRDKHGNDIFETYARIVDLEDGTVIPKTATEAYKDAEGNEIAKTYVKKDEQKVYDYTFEGSTIQLGESNKVPLGKLPDGKTLNDLVSIGVDVGVYVEGTPIDGSLRFSATKASTLVQNGRLSILAFNLTASTPTLKNDAKGNISFGVANMDIAVYSQNGELSLAFDNGSYSSLAFLAANGMFDVANCHHASIQHGHFYLYNICCYFA